jgi:hypothetical protein
MLILLPISSCEAPPSSPSPMAGEPTTAELSAMPAPVPCLPDARARVQRAQRQPPTCAQPAPRHAGGPSHAPSRSPAAPLRQIPAAAARAPKLNRRRHRRRRRRTRGAQVAPPPPQVGLGFSGRVRVGCRGCWCSREGGVCNKGRGKSGKKKHRKGLFVFWSTVFLRQWRSGASTFCNGVREQALLASGVLAIPRKRWRRRHDMELD